MSIPPLLRGLARVAGSALLLLAAAALVVWPLWRVATLYPRLYAGLVGLFLAGLILRGVLVRVRAGNRRRLASHRRAARARGTDLLGMFLALFLLANPGLGAQSAGSRVEYPRLGSLGPDDLIFRQHQEEVAAAYAAESSDGAAGASARAGAGTGAGAGAGAGARARAALILYRYVPPRDTDLLTLAARLNLPYEALATLNRLDRSRGFLAGESVLVPSIPGIFAPEHPGSDLEYLLSYRPVAGSEGLSLAATGATAPGAASAATTGEIGAGAAGTSFRFWRGARFNAEERSLFLGYLFRFPLPVARLTSGFGWRTSPISGTAGVHTGIDLAAPAGTEVYAAREGLVVEAGRDAALGEYLVLEHEGGWRSVYGHLSLRGALLNARVESGMMIGRVGSTGLSTGPHLHFEVRMNGEPRDPESLIPKKATR